MEVSGQYHTPAASPHPCERTVPVEQDAGCVSDRGWTIWRRKESLAATWLRVLDRPSLRLVAITSPS